MVTMNGTITRKYGLVDFYSTSFLLSLPFVNQPPVFANLNTTDVTYRLDELFGITSIDLGLIIDPDLE